MIRRAEVCRCGHVGASHAELNAELLGNNACQPTRGKRMCHCVGWDPRPAPTPCPLGNEAHARTLTTCVCVPGQIAIEEA